MSNIVVLVALALAADWLYAAWRDEGTYVCGVAMALGSEANLTVIGMGGLIIAILGISLGGTRHPVTFLGLLATLGGAVASTPQFSGFFAPCLQTDAQIPPLGMLN